MTVEPKPVAHPGAQLLAPIAVMAVVLLMIVPLPPLVLDLLLSVDIGLAVVLLLTVIYIKQPVEFSVFPSLLLLLTLVRLSLNVASTRLILMNGQAANTTARGAAGCRPGSSTRWRAPWRCRTGGCRASSPRG